MVTYKHQLVSEVSKLTKLYSTQKLSEKIVDVINNQILPNAISKANLPKFPSPVSLKQEELMSVRYGRGAQKPLHEKFIFLQDLEKLRYQWNGSELTGTSISTESVATITTEFQTFPKIAFEKKQIKNPFSVEIFPEQEISPTIPEELEKEPDFKLIKFDTKVSEKIVNIDSYKKFIGRLEATIREKYNIGKNYFSFSIRVDSDFPEREKTIITIDLPEASFKEKMNFWEKIEAHIKKIINDLNVSEDTKKELNRNLYTHIKPWSRKTNLSKPIIKPFKPKKFLKLAKDLINDKNYDENPRFRTAIGRAYYSAFLYVKGRLVGLGHNFSDDHKVHTEVIDALKDRGYGKTGSQLDALRQARVDSDYHMDVPFRKSDGEYFVNLSRWILDEITIINPLWLKQFQ